MQSATWKDIHNTCVLFNKQCLVNICYNYSGGNCYHGRGKLVNIIASCSACITDIYTMIFFSNPLSPPPLYANSYCMYIYSYLHPSFMKWCLCKLLDIMLYGGSSYNLLEDNITNYALIHEGMAFTVATLKQQTKSSSFDKSSEAQQHPTTCVEIILPSCCSVVSISTR